MAQNEYNSLFTCWSCKVDCWNEVDLSSHIESTGHYMQCGDCTFKAATLSEMGGHMVLKGHYIRCEDCKEVFMVVKTWRKHFSSCNGPPQGALGKGIASESTGVLQQTRDRVRPEFACFVCGTWHQNQENLSRHVEATGHLLQCGACSFMVHTPSKMGDHLKSEGHHICCKKCREEFSTIESWRRHLSDCQKPLAEFACFICKVDCLNEVSLALHATSTGHYLQCVACPTTVATPGKMKAHIARCRPEVHYLYCKDCRKVFSSVKLWRRHFSSCNGPQEDPLRKTISREVVRIAHC